MKHARKLASALLALLIVFSLAAPAFAAGSSTITVNGTTTLNIENRVFNAYKILDVQTVPNTDGSTSYVYTVPADWKNFYISYWQVDDPNNEDPTVTMNKFTGNEVDFDALVRDEIAKMTTDSDEINTFAEAALAYAVANNVANQGTATGTAENKAVFTGLDKGYYLIEDTTTPTADGKSEVVSALMLDTTDFEVTIKADVPTLKKEVEGLDADGNPIPVTITNGAIGDVKKFTLTSAVPDMTGYTTYYFTMTDTMSKGLTFLDNDANYPITVKVNGTEITTTASADAASYTVASSVNADTSKTTITVTFNNMLALKAQKGDEITVEYYGRLNDDVTLTSTGVMNEAELEYSNDPNDETVHGVTPLSETAVYYTDLTLTKTDDKGNTLTGAVFTLEGEALNQVINTKDQFTVDALGTYWALTDGTYTTVDPATLTDTTKYADTTTKYKQETVTEIQTATGTTTKTITATVDANGKLTFNGLAAGEYTITEIKAPAGYNLLKAPIKVKIELLGDSTLTEAKWKYTWTNPTENGQLVTIAEGENVKSITVINETGSELPSTGGMGTTIFYILGATLTLGAAVLLITKKRMSI